MLKKLRENFNSIKKDIRTIRKNHSEMKYTLTEMKNYLQGSTIEYMKPRIKSAIWKVRMQKTPYQKGKKKKKKESKK